MLIEQTRNEDRTEIVPSLMFVCTECECPVDYEWVTKQDVLLDTCVWDCGAPVMMRYNSRISEYVKIDTDIQGVSE